ncbi:MAG: hypothetical protein IKQ31_00140 [Clostridia bacterium]|nr:hypothetical protein [Clostridia bacterium]
MANLIPLNKILGQLKKIKHIEIYAILIGAVVVGIIWFLPNGEKEEKTNALSSTSTYLTNLETRLNGVLSAISGAGSVDCMITLDGEIERVVAYSNDEKNSSTQNTTSNGSNNTSSTSTVSKEPILISVNGKTEPLVLYEIMPSVKGVVVVASGADNIRVKLDILKAVQALLKVESSQVEIFTKQNA